MLLHVLSVYMTIFMHVLKKLIDQMYFTIHDLKMLSVIVITLHCNVIRMEMTLVAAAEVCVC